MATTDQTEPTRIVKGYTQRWKKQLQNYSATEYVLKYVFKRADGAGAAISFATTADGSAHLANLTAALSAALDPVPYNLTGYVEDIATSGATTKEVIFTLPVDVVSDPSSSSNTGNGKSFNRQVRDQLRATMLKLSSKAESSGSVNGITYTFLDLPKLRKELSYYDYLVRQEEQEERINSGQASGKNILIRFNQTQ